MCGDVELLVAEEHHAMLVQGIADLADGLVVEVLRHVDAGNLRAAGAGEQTVSRRVLRMGSLRRVFPPRLAQ